MAALGPCFASLFGRSMQITIFGLSVSSSWGNGHATIWRGLLRALSRRGHHITFFEQDVPYYAKHRDLSHSSYFEIVFYQTWNQIQSRAAHALDNSDCSLVTSYCPNIDPISHAMMNSKSKLRVYYDLDTPITLERLRRGEKVEYVPACGLSPFDLVLSFTGGRALDELQWRLGARKACALYGSVDPDIHRPVAPSSDYASDLSYLGTYAADRQVQLEQLFLEPAKRRPEKRFLIAGALYPADFPWRPNVLFIPHIPPPDHPTFYCSSKLTLNITRSAMAEFGYCPSGRLFEAAACGVPILSDSWVGLGCFFEVGREILIASNPDEAERALMLLPSVLLKCKSAARARVMAEHTADHRAAELLHLIT